ncbi:MAG: Nucleoside-diphosphate-sugar epimerase [uncultured Gemmatimonadetes bacterium]|uniref:Nucleoside-diphosphate-sugar epimerase n=1 Tax=uncultured Gemmatimonadota bacterium TaxID=203437 RepID=A0A6J4MC66_9BACT|nr:MAG: Nucleoside-diphosphate-sugar epimerase [uncultured Gemmatimonadota bacterium]
MNVLVTGATGYIGGRLVPRLLEDGHRVRVLVRDRRRIEGRAWAGAVEVAEGDLADPGTLPRAFHGVEGAYYLVHSMYDTRDFARRDRALAINFAEAAAGVPRVVYLGGLLPHAADVSEHLRSRAEVGQILRERANATELRAGPIIGSGSASFEMVRYLTERIPAMIAPRWILNDVQPVAVRDVLSYLLLALERAPGGVVEIGADRLTFRDMMQGYAGVRGLRRAIVPVPVLAPRLASLWVGFVTPIPNRLATPLVMGVVHPVVADTERARALFPEVEPIPYAQAVELALERVAEQEVPTRWSGALGSQPSYQLQDWEGTLREVRSVHVDAPPEAVFRTFSGLGGERGWLVWNWAWRLRGVMDRAVGGPGLRRGRRDPDRLLPGEALDFWRVEESDPPRLLRLRAEMRVPGKAWLEWVTYPEDGGTRLVQTAIFAPKGLSGFLYWYASFPAHKVIFSGMVAEVARRAEAGGGPSPPR